jgi:hypothetical protein
MIRIPTGDYAEVIRAAKTWIPNPILDRIQHVDFFIGDPIFAGLHEYEDTTDGRSYRTTAHCLYKGHQSRLPRDRREVTVVLTGPHEKSITTIVHELGHALHEVVGLSWVAIPMTAYAETNRHEAFAEAFCSWLLPWYPEGLKEKSPMTHELFRQLEAGF